MRQKQLPAQKKAEALAEGIVRLSSLLRHRERIQAQEQGLTSLQSAILQLCLEMEGVGNRLSPGIASKRLLVSPATLSVALKTLEKKKLILRISDKKDERSFILQLSTPGRQKAVLGKLYLNPLLKILGPIPEGQKEALFQLLDGIATRLEETPS